MLKHYLLTALRNLLRYRSTSIINIIGLSVGITCCVVILLFVRYELRFDSSHPLSDKTFRVVQHTQFAEGTSHWGTTAYPLAEALRNDFSEFAIVTQASGPNSQLFSVTDENGVQNNYEEQHLLFVDEFYPSVFTLNWIAGDGKTALRRKDAVILTHSVAKKFFGDEADNPRDILGRTIQFQNKDLLTVTAIVEDAPGNTNLRYDVLMNYAFYKESDPYQSGNWSGNYQGTTFVVMSDPSHEEAVEQKIAGWKKKYLKPDDDRRISYFLQPLKEIHNETLYGSSPGSYVMPLSIIRTATVVALLILIVASANFVNLATAQASARAKEVGVRKVLGGTRLSLVRQFIAENSLLIIATIFISIGLVQVSLSQLNTFLSVLNLRLVFQPIDVVIVFLIGLTVVMLSAVYPSVIMASFQPAEVLKGRLAIRHPKGQALRKYLIIFQFATIQFFIIATAVVAMQVDYFLSKEQGFVTESIIATPAPPFQKQEVFREKLMQQGSVKDVTFGSGPPISVNDLLLGATFRMPHQGEEEAQKCEMKVADLNYLDFYGLKLIAGRNFNSLRDPYDEFIVNEKLVSAMGWKADEALGKVLSINGYDATVVGVVEDFHNTTLQEEILPCALLNWIYFQDAAFVRIQSDGNTEATLGYIEKTWKEYSPDNVYSYAFLTDLIEKNYAIEGLIFRGFRIFSILAILVGCLGLFGLMSFMALKRTREIGVRKVLGASVAQIVSLFASDLMWLIAIAFGLAAPLAYYVTEQWLQAFVYRISISWWMLASGGVLALVIVAATVSYQSITAALANPVDSLRSE